MPGNIKSTDLEKLDAETETDDEHEISPGKGLKYENTPPPKRRRFRKTQIRRKSKTQSCGSMYSLTSARPSINSQASEPNVRFEPNVKDGGTVQINVDYNFGSFKGTDDTLAMASLDSLRNDGASQLSAAYNNLNNNNNLNGSTSGFKTSLISVLSKLGVLNQQESTTENDKCLDPNLPPPLTARSIRSGSKYFSAFFPGMYVLFKSELKFREIIFFVVKVRT